MTNKPFDATLERMGNILGLVLWFLFIGGYLGYAIYQKQSTKWIVTSLITMVYMMLGQYLPKNSNIEYFYGLFAGITFIIWLMVNNPKKKQKKKK